ncbi:hypothetical protein C4J81_09190 [Deltaproteobacteria bacterium Smac51]|nr:hypothetical protein C4J81_09190 [Deltaproteobacteria bacterium Smac51]
MINRGISDMSIQMERKQTRPINIDRLLRVQTKLDIIFNADLFRDQADVRSTMVLDLTTKMVVVAQTSPPILKSMINKDIEATFVNHDLVTSECTRWGWDSQILGINNEYILDVNNPELPPVQVVFLALPSKGALRSTNVRLDYRLVVKEVDKIVVKTNPSSQEVTLVNFSAGGAMISMPGAPQVQSGVKLHVNLTFPWPDKDSKTTIRSKAEVVRVDYKRGDKDTRLGLQFQEMDMDTNRTFTKIINHYMLAEQRQRNLQR